MFQLYIRTTSRVDGGASVSTVVANFATISEAEYAFAVLTQAYRGSANSPFIAVLRLYPKEGWR